MRKVTCLIICTILAFSCRDEEQELTSTSVISKDERMEAKIIPFRKGDLWGFSDPRGGIVLEPAYESAFLGLEGMGRIESNGLTGLVNADGKLLVSPKYNYIGDYNCGLAVFSIGGGLSGYLDTLGVEVIPARYKFAADFVNGRAIVNDGQENKLIDKNGQEIAALPGLEMYYLDYFSEARGLESHYDPSLIPVQRSDNYKIGLIDTTGRIVLKPNYDHLTKPVMGTMVAAINDMFGLIDTTGKTLTAFKFEYITPVSDTLYVASDDDKTGLLGKSGQVVLPFVYDYISLLSNGHYAVSRDRLSGVVSIEGKEVVPLKYRSLFYDHGYYTFVDESEKMGLMDEDLNVIFDAGYDLIQVLSSSRFLVDKNDKRGLMDNRGHEILPLEYSTEELGSEMGAHQMIYAERYGLDLVLLVKDHEAVIYDLNGRTINSNKWLYLSGPDKFGLYVATDLNGRLNYIGKGGLIYAEDESIKTLEVSTVEELVAAIGPNTHIILNSGDFNLGESGQMTSYVSYDSLMQSNNMIIQDVSNLKITAAADANTHLFIENAFLPVLEFRNCHNISIQGVTIGHDIEPGLCEGSVIKLTNSHYVYLDDLDLYGSGTFGVEAHMGSRLLIRNTTIRECTYGIVLLEGMYHVGFYDVVCKDNTGFDLVDVPFSNFITFDRVKFVNNSTLSEWSKHAFFKIGGHWPTVTLTDCTFEDCTVDYFSTHSGGVRLVDTSLDGIDIKERRYLKKEKIQ